MNKLMVTGIACLCTLAQAGNDFAIKQADGDGQFSFINYYSRWPRAVIPWRYNPANQPANVSKTEVLTALRTAMSRWEAVCNIRWDYQGETSAPVLTKDGIPTYGWNKGFSSVGFANFWVDTNDNIVEADIEFDYTYTSSTYLDDLTNIATHELGHALGLSHSDMPASMMFANDYHPIAFLGRLKGEDIMACARLYGGNGVISQTDFSKLPVQANAAASVRFEIGTSVPTSTASATSLSSLTPSTGSNIYFAARYTGVPVGDVLNLRFIAPDGSIYSNDYFTNQFTNAFRYGVSPWPAAGMAKLAGNWTLQLLDGDNLLGSTSYTVNNPTGAPTVPNVAIIAQQQGNGLSLQYQSFTPLSNIQNQYWFGNNQYLSASPTTQFQGTAGADNQLWFYTQSTNSRYENQSQDGADGTMTLSFTLDANGRLTKPSIIGRANGDRASATLDAELVMPSAGTQNVYIVAVLGNSFFFKTSSGWGANPIALLQTVAPAAVSLNVLDRFDLRLLPPGIDIYAGWGTSVADVASKGQLAKIYTTP